MIFLDIQTQLGMSCDKSWLTVVWSCFNRRLVLNGHDLTTAILQDMILVCGLWKRPLPLICSVFKFKYSNISFKKKSQYIYIVFEEQYRGLKRAKQQGTGITFNETYSGAGSFTHVTLCVLHNNLWGRFYCPHFIGGNRGAWGPTANK